MDNMNVLKFLQGVFIGLIASGIAASITNLNVVLILKLSLWDYNYSSNHYVYPYVEFEKMWPHAIMPRC